MKVTLEQQENGQELLQTLVTKAWESKTFKEQLIKNPKTTIESVTGEKMNLVENERLIVEDQSNTDIIYLNIPQKINLENFELTDEQLELVSGGLIITALALAGYCLLGLAIGGAGYGVCSLIDQR